MKKARTAAVNKKIKQKSKSLPSFFKPILWSYNFQKIDPQKNKVRIIVQAINYGTLEHWRWLARYYGRKEISHILQRIPATEIRPQARRLSALIFGIKKFNPPSRRFNSPNY